MPALIGSVASVATRPGARLPRRALLMAGAAAAAFLVTPDAARAACTPDTVNDGFTIHCIGTETEGLTVDVLNNSGVTTVVHGGAVVTNESGQPYAISHEGDGNVNVVVDGTVRGGANQTGLYFIDTAGGTARVGASGVVSGGTIGVALVGVGSQLDLINEGTIRGDAGSPAVYADIDAMLRLDNRAGGRIEGAVFGVGDVTNAGTIIGNVSTYDTGGQFYQRIGGVIQGNVTLGDGDDRFFLEWRDGAAAASPTGTLSAGDGIDSFGYKVTGSGANTIVFGDLSSDFERYALDLCGCDTDVTVGPRTDGGAYQGGLDITGEGDVVLQGNFTAQGNVLTIDPRFDDDEDGDATLNVTSNGTLIAQVGVNEAGISISTGNFINAESGQIQMTINGIGAIGIDASGGDIVNDGSISIGVINGNRNAIELGGTSMTNNGRIELNDVNGGGGADLELRFGRLVNNRDIILQNGARLHNFGGTVINNDTIAGDISYEALFGEAVVSNRGTITGSIVPENPASTGALFLHLAQGSSISGNVTMGAGDDILVVDASRVDQTGRAGSLDLNGLVGGTLNAGGGTDTLWVQATASRTLNVLDEAVGLVGGQFERIAYEASGNETELTLAGALDGSNSPTTIERQLRLAGDGRIVVASPVSLLSSPGVTALVVERGSTLSRTGGDGDGDLDVVMNLGVNANANVGIDVQEANSIEFRSQYSYVTLNPTAGGSATQYGIQAGSAEVRFLNLGTTRGMRLETRDNVSTIGIQSAGGSVYTDAAIVEASGRTDTELASHVTGVDLANAELTVDTGGSIDVRSSGAVAVEGTFATIINRNDIISRFVDRNAGVATGTAISLAGGNNLVRNMADALIQSGGEADIFGTAISDSIGGLDTIINRGTIKGAVNLGDSDDNFLAGYLADGTTTSVVNGVVAGGTGRDAYGRSFDFTATYDLGAVSLADTATRTGFELHGVEVQGEANTVTLTGAALTNGIRTFGDGTIVNQANVTVTSGNGIEATSRTGVQALTNSGTVVASGTGANGGAAFDAVASGLRSFANSGTMRSAEGLYAAGLTLIQTTAEAPTAVNTGTIENQSTDNLRDAWAVFGSGGAVNIANTGAGATVIAAGGVGLEVDAFEASLLNSGTISSTGTTGIGVRLKTGDNEMLNLADCDPEDLEVLARIDNNGGTIRATGAGVVSDTGIDAAVALYADLTNEASGAQINNRANSMIEATGASSVAVLVKGRDGEALDAAVAGRVTLTNEGRISGTGVESVNADLQNLYTGNIEDVASFENGAFHIGGAIHTVDTTDVIVNAATGTIAGGVVLGAGNDQFDNLGTLTGTTYMGTGNDTFRGGGTINGDVRLGDGDDTFVILAGLILNGTVYGGAGIDTLTVELSGSVNLDAAKFQEFERRAARVGEGQTATINGDATAFDTIFVDGGTLNVSAGPVLTTATSTTITGGEIDDTVNVAAGGGVAGSIVLNGGDDVVTNAGTIGGSVDLGAGNDRYVSLGGTVTGTIDGGAGTDTFEFLLTADTSAAPTGIVNFESLAVRGAHRLTLTAAQDYDTLELLEGADLTLNAGGGTVTNILGDDSDNNVVLNTSVAGRIALGGGNDVLTLTLGGTLGDIDGGEGTDTLNATLTAATTLASLAGFETANFTGASPVTLAGTLAAGQTVNFDGSDNSLTLASGAELLGTVNGGAGRDRLTLETVAPNARTIVAAQVQNFEDLVANGSGTVALTGASYGFQTVAVNGGNLSLGANTALTAGSVTFDGADSVLTLASGASLAGPVDGGAGSDTLAFVQDAGFARDLGSLNYTGFERLVTSGAGTLNIDRNATFTAGVTLGGGTTTVAAGATLTANVTGSAAGETFAALGTVAGNLDLGAGDDRLILASANAITGTTSGGAGTDTLEFRTAGTAAAPATWNGTGYTGFENLTNASGTLALSGTSSFQTVAVTGGRLIGTAGSVLTSANTIVVSQGATFGSAGTVNGNIDVRGTLSPGASPGTMTVNGNVSFASGSNLLLELTPTAQDLLNISGTLTIAQGSTVDITGVLDNLPGRVLDLVVANGGITGSFTTINKSPSVFGFVSQTGNRLQLRGEFQNSSSYVKNVQASIDYANAVLRSGQMVQAFTSALPRLVDAGGVSNAAAFGQLTPEAYASASQIGLQNGLAVTDAARNLSMTTPAQTGFFAFGQGIANWGDLAPQNRVTVGKGDVDTAGVIGGIGFGFEDGGRVGAFLGYLDAEQKLGALDASTSADGLVGGVFADAAYGSFGLHALVAYSQADAETNRTLAAAQASARGGYDLGTWIADATIDYHAELGGALVMAPKLGLTYVRTKRDGVIETGGGAFGLAVAGRSYETLYGDAAIAVSTKATLGGMGFAPYGEFGIRHRLEGDQMVAIGRFAGATGTDSLTVDGVGYGKTVARVGTGFGLDVAPNVRLNAGYGYEMGKNDRHTLTGGLSVRF